jgi:hypothetical protein
MNEKKEKENIIIMHPQLDLELKLSCKLCHQITDFSIFI